MTTWHEPIQRLSSWVFHPPRSKVGAIFIGSDVRIEPFKGHFMKYEGAELHPVKWTRNSDGWVELWPKRPLLASSFTEAKSLVTPIFPYIDTDKYEFSRRAYTESKMPELVEKIYHPRRGTISLILKHEQGFYEVQYYIYDPDGDYPPASIPKTARLSWGWRRVRPNIATFADSLDESIAISSDELRNIID